LDLRRLRRLRSQGTYQTRITTPAKVEARKDGLTEGDLDHAVQHGQVIED